MDVGKETEHYAAYINAPRDMFRDDTTERALFEQDTARARASMERAWLEAKPTEEQL